MDEEYRKIKYHNDLVVKNSIKKFDAKRKANYNKAIEEYRERADATVQFLRHVDRGGHNDLGKYFGRKALAQLRGDEIFADLRLLMANSKRR